MRLLIGLIVPVVVSGCAPGIDDARTNLGGRGVVQSAGKPLPDVKKDESIRVGDWKIAHTKAAVLYSTNGQQIHSNGFGFFKLYNQCDRDLISIILSSRNSKVMSYIGTHPEFGLAFEESKKILAVRIEYVTYRAVHEDRIIMAFTNTEVTSSFVKLIEQNPNVLVKLRKPDELTALMDVEVEGFSLKDFSKARTKATELCREVSARGHR